MNGDAAESPPGAGFVAMMLSVVAVASSVAGRSTSSVELLINVVFRGVADPETLSVVALKNPAPRTVVVRRPEPTFAAEGQRLVMVGVVAFTSSDIEMFWVLFVVGTPLAVMTNLPAYGAACGSKPVGSAEIVSVAGTPGRATPLAGVTVAQVAPCNAAVKDTGPPLAISCRVCDVGGFGGGVKLMVVALTDNVGSGAVTVSVTVIKTGEANPVAATLTDALKVPTGRPVGFTRTVSEAGSLPESGLTVSHSAFEGVMDVV